MIRAKGNSFLKECKRKNQSYLNTTFSTDILLSRTTKQERLSPFYSFMWNDGFDGNAILSPTLARYEGFYRLKFEYKTYRAPELSITLKIV